MNKMYKTLDQFNLHLDRLLGITPAQTVLPATPDPAVEAALQIAGLLNSMDLAAESAPRSELHQRWAQATAKSPAALPTRIHFTRRLAWIVALILALALLVAFRQPVMAAVGRMFGYIYVQDAGFLPADSTLVLQQPVMQEHNGLSLTVTHAVATPDGAFRLGIHAQYARLARSEAEFPAPARREHSDHIGPAGRLASPLKLDTRRPLRAAGRARRSVCCECHAVTRSGGRPVRGKAWSQTLFAGCNNRNGKYFCTNENATDQLCPHPLLLDGTGLAERGRSSYIA